MNKLKITLIATLISFMSHLAYADVTATMKKEKIDLTKKSASTVKAKKVVKEPITSPMYVEDTPDGSIGMLEIETLALQWTDTNHRFLDSSLDHSHLVASVTTNF